MLISPAIPAFISERAGQAAPFYIGVTGGMGAAGRVIGPYAMGTMYDGGGLTPVAWLAVGVAVLSFLSFAVHARISKDIPRIKTLMTRMQVTLTHSPSSNS